MKTKLILAVCLAAFVVAGCGGAKFAEEKTLLTTVTKALEAFTGSMNSANTPDAVVAALGTLTGAIEKVAPKMEKFAADHPEWETNPPEEMKETLDKFEAAKTGFQGAMPKVMSMMQQHADNPALKAAVDKLQGLASKF